MKRRLLTDESGATAIEYGLIAALIFLAVVVSVMATGGMVGDMFNYIAGKTNPVFTDAVGG